MVGQAPWLHGVARHQPHKRPSCTSDTDIDAPVPMLRMYCRWTGETLRSTASSGRWLVRRDGRRPASTARGCSCCPRSGAPGCGGRVRGPAQECPIRGSAGQGRTATGRCHPRPPRCHSSRHRTDRPGCGQSRSAGACARQPAGRGLPRCRPTRSRPSARGWPDTVLPASRAGREPALPARPADRWRSGAPAVDGGHGHPDARHRHARCCRPSPAGTTHGTAPAHRQAPC